MKTALGALVLWAFALLALGMPAPGGAAIAVPVRLIDAVTGTAVTDGIVTIGDHPFRATETGLLQLAGTPASILVRAPGYRAVSVSAAELAGAGGVVRLQPFQPRALYLTAYGIASTKLSGQALEIIARGGANALVIDLKGDRGTIAYPSKVAQASAVGARKQSIIKDLPALVGRLHALGVYFIARIVVFKDDPLARTRPEYAIRRPDGRPFRDREGLGWTDPFRPEVRQYNIDLAIEAAQAGVDEIQFDYVRFPDAATNLALALPATRANRVAAIAAFLSEARSRLARYNVFVAADIFGYVCWNTDDTGIGQQLEAIAPTVDYLSPMLYPSGFQYGIPGVRDPVANSYAIVYNSLVVAERRLGISPRRFRPWLQGFRDYAFDRRDFGAREVSDQVRAARNFGSDGWMLWNAHNKYAGAGL